MRNIFAIFIDDIKRATSNVATTVILAGLIILPSIFSWYNILACWDVFDNTGNMKVAVANLDEGYQSDLIPIRISIGENVVSSLRANDQLDWVITSEEDAIDGTRAGRYYAAVVIPESFSADMMSFYDAQATHAHIIYYSNEKKSAVAPKVTGQGADRVAYQVNEAFTATLSEVGIGILSSMSNYLDDADVNGSLAQLANHVGAMGQQMRQTAAVVRSYAGLMASAQTLLEGSAALLGQAQQSADELRSAAATEQDSLDSINNALDETTAVLEAALSHASASFDQIDASIDDVYASADTLSADAAVELRAQAVLVSKQAESMKAVAEALEGLAEAASEEDQAALQELIDALNETVALQEDLAQALEDAADDIESGNADAQAGHEEVQALAQQAKASIDGLDASYQRDIKPTMDELSREVAALAASLLSTANTIDQAAGRMQGSAGSVADGLGDAQAKLAQAATKLEESAQQLDRLSAAILEALATGDTDALRALLSTDITTLASTLAAPVAMNRQAVFPAENFGSQMAPLYTTLAIWIGSLLLLVAIKPAVSQALRRKLDNPKPRQLFLGRYLFFALVSFAQTSLLGLGNLLFLGVQAVHPMLYMICLWGAGQVSTFFIYALVVSFANLGKGIAVLLLILQVTSAGGGFPLQVLPQFFQDLSPYIPATHIINAMRAAMMGVYNNDFWIQMGMLAGFLIPAALLGLVLRKPFEKFMVWYVKKTEESKLIS